MFGNLRFLWACVNLLFTPSNRLPQLHRTPQIRHRFETRSDPLTRPVQANYPPSFTFPAA
jgi:hypothetical protein